MVGLLVFCAFAIAAALDWMAKNRVAAVNISLAGDNNALVALLATL